MTIDDPTEFSTEEMEWYIAPFHTYIGLDTSNNSTEEIDNCNTESFTDEMEWYTAPFHTYFRLDSPNTFSTECYSVDPLVSGFGLDTFDTSYDCNTTPNAAAGPITARRREGSFCRTTDDWLRRKLQYLYMIVALYVTPIAVAVFAPLHWVSFLYFFSLSCIAFVNVWMICEGILSFYYTWKQRNLHRSSPALKGKRCLCAIIAAYLPNELTVLVETVRAIATQIECLPAGTTLDIVLSHNGGSKEQRMALLEDLRKIESEIPDQVIVHELFVVSSNSKSENVNGALAFFEELSQKRGNEFTQIAMYDADHQPIPAAYRYALETMQDQNADMVMGRCCVRDGYKFIAIEFDIIYSVSHAGGCMVRGFGFFGGSNGYWDYKTLQETGMDEGMLTEDIDSSFRAQAAGHRMTYDPTIVSYEEAPPTLLALFKQRLRWSQGWCEVTLRQRTLMFRNAPGLTLWSRFCIFMLLPFREVYTYLSSFTVPISIVYLVRSGCGVACLDYRLVAFFVFCLKVPILMTLAAWYLTVDRKKNVHYRMPTLTPRDYFRYILVSYFYEFAKFHVTVMAHARHFLGLNAWVVTKRKTTKSTEQAVYMPAEVPITRPESLIENSPYAPSIRRLFAQAIDARNINSLRKEMADTETIIDDESGWTRSGHDDVT